MYRRFFLALFAVEEHCVYENTILIQTPELAAHFTREMNRMWRSAELGITPRIRKKLERQRAKCGGFIALLCLTQTGEQSAWKATQTLVVELVKYSVGKYNRGTISLFNLNK